MTPEAPDPVAAKAPELVTERLAGVRIVENYLERGSNLAPEHGMEAADERRDLVRNSQAAWRRHAVVSRRGTLVEKLFERVEPAAFLLQRAQAVQDVPHQIRVGAHRQGLLPRPVLVGADEHRRRDNRCG